MPSSTIGRNCESNVRATNPAPMQSATAPPSTRYGCLHRAAGDLAVASDHAIEAAVEREQRPEMLEPTA